MLDGDSAAGMAERLVVCLAEQKVVGMASKLAAELVALMAVLWAAC
jgi:hypothetical protein